MKKNISLENSDAVLACEKFLVSEKEYNISHTTLKSETVIIERMLNRRLELFEFYKEIYTGLEPKSWQRVLSITLFTAAFWSPEDAESTRNSRDRLKELNGKIRKQANSLSLLLNEREEISEKSELHSHDKYHVVDIIESASISNGLFGSYLKKPLKQLSRQFDSKYWPSISKFLEVLALDAENSSIQAIDSITEASISSSRGSLTDYFKALFQAINESKSLHNLIPDKFNLSNDSLATIANCSLDLKDDEIKDAQYVKRLKQRINNQ